MCSLFSGLEQRVAKQARSRLAYNGKSNCNGIALASEHGNLELAMPSRISLVVRAWWAVVGAVVGARK